MTAAQRSMIAEFAATIVGCLLVSAALAIIWAARVAAGRDLYVSELGAQGEPTAQWFRAALLLIVAGGSLIAFAARRIRSAAPILRLWAPAISLWVGCGFFLVASQVTCTAHCPLPVGPTFTWQDFTHTTVAVLAFAAACWAMLQISFTTGNRMLAVFSLACGGAVAVVAGAGGILSLARFQAAFGSRLELLATTIAIGWLVILGALLATGLARGGALGRRVRALDRPGRSEGGSRSRPARSSGIPARD